MIEVKEIKDLVREYMSRTVSTGADYHRKWPYIAGENLRKVTSFAKMDGNVICIYAKGSAARSRLMLEKRRILDSFRKEFPGTEVSDIRIISMDRQ